MTNRLSPHEPLPTKGYHVLQPDWPEQTGKVRLSNEAAKHYVQVLRIQPGEPLSLTNGSGHIAQTAVTTASKQCLEVEITQTWVQEPYPNKLTLLHALPKAKKLDEVIRRACELGVDAFYPVQTDRCDRKLDSNKAQANQERWQAIANSATEQSRRAHTMHVMPVQTLKQVASQHHEAIALWEEATVPLQEVLTARTRTDLTLLIGPEGGLTEDEIRNAQFTPASLGPRILRTETAGVTAAALGAWHLGRLT